MFKLEKMSKTCFLPNILTFYILPQSGDSVVLDDCARICSCRDGSMSCERNSCEDGTSCLVGKDGNLGCQPESKIRSKHFSSLNCPMAISIEAFFYSMSLVNLVLLL